MALEALTTRQLYAVQRMVYLATCKAYGWGYKWDEAREPDRPCTWVEFDKQGRLYMSDRPGGTLRNVDKLGH